uniref:Uncharacterized protein n=2 Tax=Oryza TaxID=4527 RepID=A0A0D3EWN2_9ORYZ
MILVLTDMTEHTEILSPLLLEQ